MTGGIPRGFCFRVSLGLVEGVLGAVFGGFAVGDIAQYLTGDLFLHFGGSLHAKVLMMVL